jgi:hypothetical protein
MTPFSLLACEPHLEAGSKIYVDAADGFDDDVAAAVEKKKVPVAIVNSRDEADYQLGGISDYEKTAWAKMMFTPQIRSDDQAGIKLVDLDTGEVVFAYPVDKKNRLFGRQTAAEVCAKHLLEAIG